MESGGEGGLEGAFKKEGVVLTGRKSLKWTELPLSKLDFNVRRMFSHTSSSKGKQTK